MSVEFRKRNLGEIVQILRRHIWLLTLPTLASLFAVLWVLPGLPNIYRSTTFLSLTPPAISEKVAPSLTDADLSQRLQSIGATVLSRSSLEEVIAKYGLYQEERAAGMTDGLIIDKMKGRIFVEKSKSDNNQIIGFRLTFRHTDALNAQLVTAELAERYINAQNQESRASAETTKAFIDEQMTQAKAKLDELEGQRLGIMVQNVDTLPESSQGLIAQLTGLRQREATISKDRESLMTERGRLQESIRALNSQMRLIENFGEKETQEAVNQASRIEDTPAYAELIKKRAEYSSKLEMLRKQFREKYPDIVQAQIDINKINEELEKLSRSTSQRIKAANESVSRKAELQKRSMEIERDRAESQIDQIGRQIEAKDAEVRQNSVQIAALESKINTIPNVKVALEGVNNQYLSAKANYDELLKKFNSAQQQVQRETNEQGETITVIDPANLPEKAENASKRPMFLGLGAGMGLFFGLFLAACIEVPKVLKLQNIVDTEYYTGLPVLATVPPLLSEGEIASNKRRHKLWVAAGAVSAVAAVPVLIVAFETSRLFERLS